eukprot:2666988-Rhodomonas_salina.1
MGVWGYQESLLAIVNKAPVGEVGRAISLQACCTPKSKTRDRNLSTVCTTSAVACLGSKPVCDARCRHS